jgi:Flp pilus assembly protein TadG
MLKKFREFGRDRRGALAVAFAVAMYPIMMMICAAVDLSRMSQQQARLQAALDAAALFVARLVADGKSPADLSAAARQIVEGNVNPTEMFNVNVSAVMDGASIRVTGSGQLNPMIGWSQAPRAPCGARRRSTSFLCSTTPARCRAPAR